MDFSYSSAEKGTAYNMYYFIDRVQITNSEGHTN